MRSLDRSVALPAFDSDKESSMIYIYINIVGFPLEITSETVTKHFLGVFTLIYRCLRIRGVRASSEGVRHLKMQETFAHPWRLCVWLTPEVNVSIESSKHTVYTRVLTPSAPLVVVAKLPIACDLSGQHILRCRVSSDYVCARWATQPHR